MNSISWWQTNGNDDDLQQTDYDRDEVDDDVVSTASSDDSERAVRAPQRRHAKAKHTETKSPRRPEDGQSSNTMPEHGERISMSSYSDAEYLNALRKVHSSRIEQASRSPRTAPPPPPKQYSKSERKAQNTIQWNCEACTFFNSRECRSSKPQDSLTCEMCSTAYVVPYDEERSLSPLHSKTESRTSKPETTQRASSEATAYSTGSSSKEKSTTSRSYSVSELVQSLGAANATDGSLSHLPTSLERRIQDFRFAQKKRREKHGDQRPWGIYGLYAHLSDIRADLEWAEDAAWRRRHGQPYLSWKDFDDTRQQGLHSKPYFTYGVMVLCTIMVFVTFGVNGWKFEPLTINPLIGPSSETLVACGARDTNLIVNENQWFRLFTPMVLHAGLVHFFVNMLALYFIGGAVEKAHGAFFTAVLFVLSAVGGNIISAICLPGFISVGASGGIFGLIGACMADICLNWNLLFLKTTTEDDNLRSRHLCVLLWLAIDIFINCLLGFTPFVDNFTHLGGFMYGFCIGFASIERLASRFFGISSSSKDSVWAKVKGILFRYFGLVLSVVVILATTIVLAQSDGVTSPCHGCRYISCVPFPPNAEEKWWYCDDCDVVTADLFVAQDGSGLFEEIDVHCPNGEIEEIGIISEGIYDREVLRRKLPSYCREHCSEVFVSH